MRTSTTRPAGDLGLRVINKYGAAVDRVGKPRPSTWWELTKAIFPTNSYKLRNFRHMWRGYWKLSIARLFNMPHFYGQLSLTLRKGDGTVVEYGIVSLRVVTTTGVGFIVDAFQNIVELEIMNFHGFGTGGGAEAVGNTALTTELTTQYVADNTRPTGTQSEAAANIYRTVGTLDPDADVAITEHGIFSQAATGGGVLLDRTLFSVINLVGATGDTLQATYDFTVTSGG